jgi:hypothetical protein
VTFYDRSGREIDLERWQLLFHDRRYQQVAYTEVGDYEISTVWLGIDYGFGHLEKPLIFETMIFGPHLTNEEQWRYSTEEDATAGHWNAVTQVSLLESVTQ